MRNITLMQLLRYLVESNLSTTHLQPIPNRVRTCRALIFMINRMISFTWIDSFIALRGFDAPGPIMRHFQCSPTYASLWDWALHLYQISMLWSKAQSCILLCQSGPCTESYQKKSPPLAILGIVLCEAMGLVSLSSLSQLYLLRWLVIFFILVISWLTKRLWCLR